MNMYIMYTYLSIFTITIMILVALWFNSKVLSNTEYEPFTNENTTEKRLTKNSINYDEIDNKINLVERQMLYIESLYNNINFAIGEVITNINPLEEPRVRVGGNLSNILLNFYLSPPQPGEQGETGETGEIGEKGITGITGNRGTIGGNSLDKM
jgi:hypothetical protein